MVTLFSLPGRMGRVARRCQTTMSPVMDPPFPNPPTSNPHPPPHTAMPPSPPGRSEAGRRQARRLGQPTPDPLRLPCDPQPSIGVELSGPAAGWHRSLVPHLIPLPCPFANAPRSVLSSRTLIAGPVFLFQIRQSKFRVQPDHHIFGGATPHGKISFHKNEKNGDGRREDHRRSHF